MKTFLNFSNFSVIDFHSCDYNEKKVVIGSQRLEKLCDLGCFYYFLSGKFESCLELIRLIYLPQFILKHFL